MIGTAPDTQLAPWVGLPAPKEATFGRAQPVVGPMLLEDGGGVVAGDRAHPNRSTTLEGGEGGPWGSVAVRASADPWGAQKADRLGERMREATPPGPTHLSSGRRPRLRRA